MADLISRAAAIDAIVSAMAFPDAKYIKNVCQNTANSEDWLGGVCDAINAVEDVNTVDAVPVVHAIDMVNVVRCKDCKYRDVSGYYPVCKFDSADPYELSRNAEDDDWFCADGERRDDDG